MYAILWQITARYLRIEAERLNFSTRRYSDLKKNKKKIGRKKKRKKTDRKGAPLFFTFLQSKQLLQKG